MHALCTFLDVFTHAENANEHAGQTSKVPVCSANTTPDPVQNSLGYTCLMYSKLQDTSTAPSELEVAIPNSSELRPEPVSILT